MLSFSHPIFSPKNRDKIKITAVNIMCGYKQQGILSLAFGLGLTLSFLFPESLIIVIVSIVIVTLSIALIKC